MVLLGDKAQAEAHFNLFGDGANLDARLVHGLPRTYHRLRNHFGHTRWNCKVTLFIWNLASFRLETVLASVPYRCTLCVERTIDSEIGLDAPDGTTRWRGSCGILFGPFEMLLVLVQYRCIVCAKCTMGSEIILDTPDGTPRWQGSSGSAF